MLAAYQISLFLFQASDTETVIIFRCFKPDDNIRYGDIFRPGYDTVNISASLGTSERSRSRLKKRANNPVINSAVSQAASAESRVYESEYRRATRAVKCPEQPLIQHSCRSTKTHKHVKFTLPVTICSNKHSRVYFVVRVFEFGK